MMKKISIFSIIFFQFRVLQNTQNYIMEKEIYFQIKETFHHYFNYIFQLRLKFYKIFFLKVREQ